MSMPPPPPPPPSNQSYGSGSSNPPQVSTSKVPVEKVVDDLALMGFAKDDVRAVIKRLAENGQSVDLNVVLDKLMNGEGSSSNKGGPSRPGSSWFSR